MANKAKKIPHAAIKGLRAEQDISMAQMAKIIGICEGSYLAKENGTREWRSSEMVGIARFFKRSLDELFI